MKNFLISSSAILLAMTCSAPVQAQVDASEEQKIAQGIDAVIASDSRGWFMNRYNPGHVRNVKILELSEKGDSGVVYAEYMFNGGSWGWIKLRLNGESVECVEYWDFRGTCRPVGSMSPAYGVVADAFVASMSSSGGNSYSGSSSGAYEDPCQVSGACSRGSSPPPPPMAPPPPPISPFYGSCHNPMGC